MFDRTIILVDGENLTLRYQNMLKNGLKPAVDTKHVEDTYVWHSGVIQYTRFDLLRVSYYTTVVGDDLAVEAVSAELSEVAYKHLVGGGPGSGKGTLNPHVYKKKKKDQKTASVDINITVDALRHAYNDSVDSIYLLSGDGDYLPVID